MASIRGLAVRAGAAVVGIVLGAGIASAASAAVLKARLPDRAEPEDDELDFVVIYDGRTLRSTAAAFRGGRAVCWYAGADLDLRGARLDPAGARLEAWTVFGGLSVKVPEDWRVRLRGVAVMGAGESSAPEPEAGYTGPVLEVRHRTVFGGFGIQAEPPDKPEPAPTTA